MSHTNWMSHVTHVFIRWMWHRQYVTSHMYCMSNESCHMNCMSRVTLVFIKWRSHVAKAIRHVSHLLYERWVMSHMFFIGNESCHTCIEWVMSHMFLLDEYMCGMTHSSNEYMCDMTHYIHVWHDTLLIQNMCDMTLLIQHMCDVSYCNVCTCKQPMNE